MKPTHICFYKVKVLYGTLSLIQANKVTFLVYRNVGGVPLAPVCEAL